MTEAALVCARLLREGPVACAELAALDAASNLGLRAEVRLETLFREFGDTLGSRTHIKGLVSQLRRLGFLGGHGEVIEAGPLLELGVDGERMIAFIRRKVLAELLTRGADAGAAETPADDGVEGQILELELHHWDLWRAVRVPLDADVVLVTGPNGSGKTTPIDAIRQLLNAPRLSSRRRFQHYLRQPDAPALIRAVVSNVDPGGAPPFRRERLTTPEVTLACALVPSGGGTPEKRFAVLPGRSSPDELRTRRLESRDFYRPERHGRVPEHAGVSRSLMSARAIEQGKTNSLFELKPRELFQRVLEMLGDQAILERYREARRRYEDTDRELMRQGVALGGAQAELTRVRREVQRLADWEEARDKVAELQARLPAAELQRLLSVRREATSKSRELQTKVRLGEVELTEAQVRREHALHSGVALPKVWKLG